MKTVLRIDLHMTRCKAFKWGLVICDEATALRNPNSQCWRTIHAIPKDCWGGASATPAQNRITDYKGFALMVWQTADDILERWCPSAELDLLKTNEVTYDANSDKLVTSTYDDDPIVASLKQHDQQFGWKWWFLSPECQDAIRDSGKADIDELAEKVLQQSGFYIINRGMNTSVTLPNGTVYYPRDGIPPMTIYTVIVGYGKLLFDAVLNNTDEILRNVTLGEIEQVADDQVDMNLDKGKKLEKNNALDMALIRAATIEAQSKQAHEMMLHPDAVTQCTDAAIEEGTTKSLAALQEKLQAVQEQLGAKINPRQQMKQDLDGKGSVKLGVDFVQSLVENSVDGGISYTYSTLNTDYTHIPPADRLTMLYFTLAKCSLKAYCLRQVLEIRQKPGESKARVLIVTNSPIMQQ